MLHASHFLQPILSTYVLLPLNTEALPVRCQSEVRLQGCSPERSACRNGSTSMNRVLLAACLFSGLGVVCAQAGSSSDALFARIKAMAEIPSTYNAVYSPDGKRIAFISNRSGTPQVWLVDAAGESAKQITQTTDPIGSLAWSPVDDTIAYDVARGGGYNAQVFLSRPDGTEVRRITSGGKEDNLPAHLRQTDVSGFDPTCAIRRRLTPGSTNRDRVRRPSPSSTTAWAESMTSNVPAIGRSSPVLSRAATPIYCCTTWIPARRSC